MCSPLHNGNLSTATDDDVTMCVESACKPATILLNGTSPETVDWKDAQWIMTTAVIIFTMQTGASKSVP